jgi:hypothetical protein
MALLFASLSLAVALAPVGTQTSTASSDLSVSDQPERYAPASATSTAAEAFVKGEIANAGSIRLVPINSFVGLRLGATIEDLTLYATIAPKIDLLLLENRLRISLELPMNFEVYSTRTAANSAVMGGTAKDGFKHFGSFRSSDYQTARDYVRILRAIAYGKKEDNFYLNVGQLYATTIGHGQAMRRYTANVDFNSYIVGGEVDAYADFGGFEFALADVTRGNVFGGLAFVKPLFFTTSPIAKSWSLGATWSSDQKAPLHLRRDAAVPPSMVGPVQLEQCGSMTDPKPCQPLQPTYDTAAVNVIGVDSELKVYKNESTDLKVYADFSTLKGAGNGATFGLLGRFNFRAASVLQILRTRLELRSYDPNFQPSYFDVMYEFQKIQYVTNPNDPSSPTKLAYILGRTGSRRFGSYAEVSYGLMDWFIVAAAFETDTTGEDRNLMLHAELPWRFLHVFATYQQRNFSKPFSLSKSDSTIASTETDLIFAGARLQLLPVLFINGRAQRNLAWDPSKFANLGGYSNQTKFLIDVEFGFQF